MKVQHEQQKAADEINTRHYRNGKLAGIMVGFGVSVPPLLVLGHKASINPVTMLEFIVAEAATLATVNVGGGYLRRLDQRLQRSQSTPDP